MQPLRRISAAEAAPAGRKRRKKSGFAAFWSDFGYLIVTALVVVLVFRVLLQLSWVPSGSMETTIPKKDAADLVAAALCDGRPGAGAREHRHFLER